jgi:3-hydroxyisobutyrate dehydrogenase
VGVVHRVGFIGLGSQGGPIARRIAEAGFPTTLWARRPGAVESFADTGAAIADSPAALAKASDVVFVCVVNDADVDEVVAGPDGVLTGLAEGGVVVVHSTVHPDTCRRLAERAAQQGVGLLDAPVSGGGAAAAGRRLVVMAGGDAAVLESCRPIIETYGKPVLHLGPVGSGQVAKLLNNLLFAAGLSIAEGAYGLGRDLGVDLGSLGQVFANGSARSYAADTVGMMGARLEALADVAGALLRKDVGLLVELATAAGADTGAVLPAADAALKSLRHPR